MDKKIVKQIVEVFTKEQFAIEIGKVLTNTEIDMWIGAGCKILGDAQEILEKELFDEAGMTRKEVELEIKKIEYNLNEFTKAFMKKENAMLLMKDSKPMFFHMN
tara:strand:- start:1250 stop:1561 length:312 start_codon:yes stop_codon:yes gene_type:complete